MLLKAFRLFVSSTFADFGPERNVLQQQVFPSLDAYCAAKGYQFYPLDLRWGVNEEAQLDQRTAEICLNEVRAAKKDYPPPNFLILIGNRYGFVPLPYAIAEDEFKGIIRWLEGGNKQDAADALRTVYRRDDNYPVPGSTRNVGGFTAAFTLRSRADELPELRSAGAWAAREAELRTILQEAADALLAAGTIHSVAHEKYFLSLTDQEIVLGLPGYKGIAESVGRRPGPERSEAIAFIRDIAGPADSIPGSIQHYFERAPRLENLKAGIRRALPGDHIITARADVDENGRFSPSYLANFAFQIEKKLKESIDQYIARVEAIEREPDHALQSERAAHRTFAERRLGVFVGREDTLAAIGRYLTRPGDFPLVLYGRSGFGKSAVMARAFADSDRVGQAPVIARFVGASAAASNMRAMLISLIEDLAAHALVENPSEFEHDANKFKDQIARLLSSISSPTIIFIDALDQLQKPRDLDWLPLKLPAALKLVVSVLDDAAFAGDSDLYRDFRDRYGAETFVEIPPLGSALGRDMISELERQTHHRLQQSQRDYLIAKYETAGGSPLFLRTAFAIAQNWKSYNAPGVGRYVLAENIEMLIAQFIDELSSVQHHELELVARMLGFLAAAKNGLSAKELTEVLSRDTGVLRAISSERHGALTNKLPPSVWVRLNRDLAPFLTERLIDDQPLLQFFHRQVADVARSQHYDGVKLELHAALVAYFETQMSEEEGKRVYSLRSLSELPYQLNHAEKLERLEEILMSPDWMQQKLNAFGPRPLIEDYRYARTRAQALPGEALELAADPLSRDPRQLTGQLIGRLTPGPWKEIDNLLRDLRASTSPPALVPHWASRLTAAGGPEIRRFEGHGGPVTHVIFSQDGRHIVSNDGTLRVWEVASGREIRSFINHTGPVSAAALSPDGKHIVFASRDHTLGLWELASGRESRRFEGESELVTAVAFSPDGRWILSTSSDHVLQLWDVESGQKIRRMEGAPPLAFSPDGRHIVSRRADTQRTYGSHSELVWWDAGSGRESRVERFFRAVRAFAFSPDGRQVFLGEEDGGRLLFDTAADKFRQFKALERHNKSVTSVAFSCDGRAVVSGSLDETVRVTLDGWRELVLQGHGREVRSVGFSPDGRHVVSGSDDGTVRLWEIDRARDGTFVHRTPLRNMNAIAFSHDGSLIVTGGGQNRGDIRLWEVASGREIHRFDGLLEVHAVAFSPDGQHIVSENGRRDLTLWEVGEYSIRAQLFGHQTWGSGLDVTSIAYSPDGRQIVSGSRDKTLRLWEASSRRQISRFEGHSDTVNAVAFSADGGHILSGSSDQTLRLWEVASGQSRLFAGHKGQVTAVAFLPDGRHIVSCTWSEVRLWETVSGRDIWCFEIAAQAVAFYSNGYYIIAAADKTLRVWETASGREVARFQLEHAIRAVASHGSRLAAGDAAGYVHLFDVILDDQAKAIWLRGLNDAGLSQRAELPPISSSRADVAPPATEYANAPWYTFGYIEAGGGDHEMICKSCERCTTITPRHGQEFPSSCPQCGFKGPVIKTGLPPGALKFDTGKT